MRIAGVGSAFPGRYFKQEELVGELKDYWADQLPQPGILDRLDESMKVEGRFLARPVSLLQKPADLGRGQRRLDRDRTRDRRKITLPRSGGSGSRTFRSERHFCHVHHGYSGAFD